MSFHRRLLSRLEFQALSGPHRVEGEFLEVSFPTFLEQLLCPTQKNIPCAGRSKTLGELVLLLESGGSLGQGHFFVDP